MSIKIKNRKSPRIVQTINPIEPPEPRVGHTFRKDLLQQSLRTGKPTEALCGQVFAPKGTDFEIMCSDCERLQDYMNREIIVNPTDIQGAVFIDGRHVGEAVLYDHGEVRIQALGKIWWHPRWWGDDDKNGPQHNFVIQIKLSDIPDTAADYEPNN